MMKLTTVKEIFADYEQFLGSEITVGGWIRTSRDSKAFGFIELNDGSYLKNIQIVATEEKLVNFREVMKVISARRLSCAVFWSNRRAAISCLKYRRRKLPWRVLPLRSIRCRKNVIL